MILEIKEMGSEYKEVFFFEGGAHRVKVNSGSEGLG